MVGLKEMEASEDDFCEPDADIISLVAISLSLLRFRKDVTIFEISFKGILTSITISFLENSGGKEKKKREEKKKKGLLIFISSSLVLGTDT